MGLNLHQHRQVVVDYQLMGTGHPFQGAGKIFLFFGHHAQLSVGARRSLDIAKFLKYFPGLMVPVFGGFVLLLFME